MKFMVPIMMSLTPVSVGPASGQDLVDDRALPTAVETLTVASSGVAARFYPAVRPNGAAVLLLVGSEGGFAPAELARQLAAAGHSVLAVAYFSGMGPELPGLPRRLEGIPLEYFDRALNELASRTHQPLAVIGESRGAEAALLIASRRSDVRLVVAFAPTSTVWQAAGTGGKRPARAAWTTGGEAIPYTVQVGKPGQSSAADFSDALKTSSPDTHIPVGNIHARTLLVAGSDDQIWPSAVMAKDIATRMRRAGRTVELAIYRDAGHLLMGPGPGESRIVTPDFTIEFGGTEAGNLAARNTAWQRALALLDLASIGRH